MAAHRTKNRARELGKLNQYHFKIEHQLGRLYTL